MSRELHSPTTPMATSESAQQVALYQKKTEVESPNGVVSSPELDRIVASLSQAIQNTMTSLYSLQTAVANSVTGGRGSIALLNQLKTSRESLRETWEEYIRFLERCRGYAEDYIALCKYSATHSRKKSAAPAIDLLSLSRKLLEETQGLKDKHEKEYAQLRQYRSSLLHLFRRPTSVMMIDKVRWTRRAPSRSSSLDSSLDQFVHAAEASLRPDGTHVLHATESGLIGIRDALRDIHIFWEGQRDHVTNVLEQKATMLPPPQEVRELSEKWERYRAAIQAAVSSISISSDAATVDAADAVRATPKPNADEPFDTRKGARERSGSFLYRLFGLFGRS